jgi:hypothetical protein
MPSQVGVGKCGPSNAAVPEMRATRAKALFEAALAHYSGSPPSCVRCGRPDGLSIDHIIPRSATAGYEPTADIGLDLWARLKKEGYPPGYQVLCRVCNSSKGGYRPSEVYPSDKVGRPLLSVRRRKAHDRRGHFYSYIAWVKPGYPGYNRRRAEAAKKEWERRLRKPEVGPDEMALPSTQLIGSRDKWIVAPAIRVPLDEGQTVRLPVFGRSVETWRSPTLLLDLKIRFELESGIRLPLTSRGSRHRGGAAGSAEGPPGFRELLRAFGRRMSWELCYGREIADRYFTLSTQTTGEVSLSYEVGALRAIFSDPAMMSDFVAFIRSRQSSED